MIETFPIDSPFITEDSRTTRWAVPYHYAALNSRVENLIVNNIYAIKSKQILDLGCHFGTFSQACLIHGASSVTGVDSEEALVAKAESLFSGTGIEKSKYLFIAEDVTSYLKNQADDSYDTVLCLGLLYYIPDPFHLLQEMKRIAKRHIIIDTFTAYYGAIISKEGEQILRQTIDDTFRLPLILFPYTQSEKGDYTLKDHFINKKNTKISLLALPSIPALENFFEVLRLCYTRIPWGRYVIHDYSWKDLASQDMKKKSHWADIYHTDVRVSFILEKREEGN